ncbi:DNA ligase 4 [Phlebotomus argentipes]|uniref:DNA ligase 4 n=1 Tax=Phlebotomus argentipes TaxID=94469 RepID=UPI0028935A42|nr:DNA ligase 4 [Phlebotomus argentipes]
MSGEENLSCISRSIKFSSVTELLEKIKESKGLNKKEELFRKFLKTFQDFQKDSQITSKNQKTSFHPILRLLLPACDMERSSYGIKEVTLGRLYIRMLGIDGKSADAKTLLEGRASSADYGEIVYRVMKTRSKPVSEITVFEVNQGLDSIVDHYQNGRMKKIDDILMKLISNMTASDQKWLSRIILKHLPLGLGRKKIFNVLHPKAEQQYNISSNLYAVCELLDRAETSESGAIPQLPEVESVKIFNPVKPMLLARIEMHKLEEAVNRGEYFIETKMDGERFHVHRSGNEYRFFSRNGHNYSEKFGKDFTSGSLTPFIHNLFAKHVVSIILDGEMMVWNREDNLFYVKGDNYDVKNILRDDSKLKPVLCVYDVLFLNGESLTEKPYAERRRLLATLLKEKTGALILGEYKKVRDFDHVLECFNESIDRCEEGIVIKAMGSHYRPGVRSIEAGWFKCKPDYINGVVSDLDLLIIGGYYEPQKRYMESYLLGIYANGPGERNDPVFYSVAKVSAQGLKFADRRKLSEDLRARWRPVEQEKVGRKSTFVVPQCLEWQNAVPDAWIEPNNSIVLEIKATELTKTTTFRTTHALKFPRIVAVREDKHWYDACALEEFQQLCGRSETGVKKLAKRHITRDDAKRGTAKRRIVAENRNLKHYRDHVLTVSSICENLKFCILSTSRNMPNVHELRQMIWQHSGEIVENPGASTFAIIAGDMTLNVRKYAEKKLYNIAKVEWLMKTLGSGTIPKKLPRFHPKDMISCTEELEDYFTKSFDDYGDSLTIPVDCASLKTLLGHIEIDRSERLLRRELISIEEEIYANSHEGRNIFRPFSAHFFAANQCDETKLAEIIFKSRHGNVIDEFISSDCTLIAINPLKDLLDQFKRQFSSQGNIQLVSIAWIAASHSGGKIANMSDYLIPLLQ